MSIDCQSDESMLLAGVPQRDNTGTYAQLWYADSAQVEGMGGCILGWGVFGPFRNLTTDSSMGTPS